jgi:hypothetical protein
MKKGILLILILCFSSFLNAQDIHFIETVNGTVAAKADSLAQNIVKNSALDYKLYKTKNKTFKRTYYFIPKSIDTSSNFFLSDVKKVLKVSFYKQKQSDGSIKFKLHTIHAPYLAMVNVWQKYFNSTATASNLKEQPKLTSYKKDNANFALYKQNNYDADIWQLLNKS